MAEEEEGGGDGSVALTCPYCNATVIRFKLSNFSALPATTSATVSERVARHLLVCRKSEIYERTTALQKAVREVSYQSTEALKLAAKDLRDYDKLKRWAVAIAHLTENGSLPLPAGLDCSIIQEIEEASKGGGVP